MGWPEGILSQLSRDPVSWPPYALYLIKTNGAATIPHWLDQEGLNVLEMKVWVGSPGKEGNELSAA